MSTQLVTILVLLVVFLIATVLWLLSSVKADLRLYVITFLAFVALGFEHSVANMYFIPLGMILEAAAGQPVEVSGLFRNLVPVIAGNIAGGSVLVALVYYVIYRWPGAASTLAPSRKASEG